MLGKLLAQNDLNRPFSRGALLGYSRPRYGTRGAAGVTASGSTNTKGSYAQVIASTSIDCDGFYVGVTLASALADFLIDIATGAAASEVDIVSNILCSSRFAAYEDAMIFYVPLAVRQGTRISSRCQSTDASASPTVYVTPVRGGIYKAMRCYQSETLGAVTGDSGGTQVDPGGTINTKGSYAQLTAATSRRIRHLLFCVGSQNNATRTAADHQYDLAVGAGGSESIVIPDIPVRQGATLDGLVPAVTNFSADIPAGTRIACRAQCTINDATDRLSDVAVVGFY